MNDLIRNRLDFIIDACTKVQPIVQDTYSLTIIDYLQN
jgi:hypothetical protein